MNDFRFRFSGSGGPKQDRDFSPRRDIGPADFKEIRRVEEELSVMISRVEDMTRMLPTCLIDGDSPEIDLCETLDQEVRRQAKALTRRLIATRQEGELPHNLIRFPLRLERIADELEGIVTCCRIKARDNIEFSEDAHAELDQLLAIIGDMFSNLRDVMTSPDQVLLEHVLAQGIRVTRSLQETRLAHWMRLESGDCTPEAGSLFLDILDTLKSSTDYLQKMASGLLALFCTDMKSSDVGWDLR